MFKVKKTPLIVAAIIAALTAFPSAVAAQTAGAPAAILAYADNPDAVEIVDSSGVGRMAMIGDEIKGGETVKTAASAAEIKLDPNGSIIKVARNTSFKVNALAGSAGGGDTNEFALLGGKIRTVAARSKAGNKYLIRTPTAVCGVRGTDFSLNAIAGMQDSVMVKKGLVEFSKVGADGALQPVMVAAGQFADAFAEVFAAAAFTPEQFASEFGDVEFTTLDPEAVPDEPPAPPSEEEKKAEEEKPAEAVPAEEPKTETAPATELAKPKVDASKSKIMGWLGDMVGFEIGSVVIDGNTYSKAVIQPTFNLGKLRMSLYLPVIYTSDLFNPDTWYHPLGNDEWDFGAGDWNTDPVKASLDAFRDLALKIRYIEYGDQAFDPVYLKIGNLSSMTIGHGVLMRNFANDSDFPAVRRVGLNVGADSGFWGVEGVVNDLADPQIFGGRVKVLKFIGLSMIADIDPAGDLPDPASVGDPVLFGAGADLDFPLIRGSTFGLRAFADIAAVIPATRSSYTIDGVTIDPGFHYESVYDPDLGSGLDALNNYGIVAGFMGKVLFLDWRLEYRRYKGAYQPTFFNSSYERNRAVYAERFANMLVAPADTTLTQGIFGEASFALLKDKISFDAGYMMPWGPDGMTEDVLKDDYILAKLEIKKGVIPIIDVSGSFSYERTGFAYALTSNAAGVSLFDAYTVLKGELTYPIAETVDFAIIVSTAASHDADGAVIFEDGKPKVAPTITFETRVHF